MIGTILAYFLAATVVAAPIALGVWIDRHSGRVLWSGWRAEFAEIGRSIFQLAGGILTLAGGLLALAIIGIMGISGLAALSWLATLSVPILLVGIGLLLLLMLLTLIASTAKG